MELTRRELLRTAAGAALAAGLPACAVRRRPIGGALVGGSDARGHLLRGAGGIPPVAGREEVPVVVVGGGVAGLSAAWRLRRAGFDDFLLLELEDSLGGTAVSGENAVSRYPWGSHYVPVPTREQGTLCLLLEEAGVIRGFDGAGRALPAEDHLLRAPQERLFYRGFWSEGLYLHDGASAEDLRQWERFEETVDALARHRGADGRRAFAIPVEGSSADPELRALDRISMARWLDERGFDSPRLRWMVEYSCRDDFGGLLGETSAWAGLHYFAARRAAGEESEFLTWPEGTGFLVRHLARSLGGRRRTGAVAVALEPRDGRVTVRYVDVAAGTSREVSAERVVCAVPRFVARRLLPELGDGPTSFSWSPWVVANLTLREPPRSRGFPLAWDNVLYESDSLGYVVATHQSDRTERSTVLTWYRPFAGPEAAAARGRILATPWEGWRDAVMADLAPAHPGLEGAVERIDVWRWGHGMVRPVPGFLWGEERRAACLPRGRIHFAGTDLGGLPLFEEAQWSGVRAAEEVLAALGRPFASAL